MGDQRAGVGGAGYNAGGLIMRDPKHIESEYRNDLWVYRKEHSDYLGLPAIVCDHPDRRILSACVLNKDFDSFVFHKRRFGFESVSWPIYNMTLEREDVDLCYTRILDQVPRIRDYPLGEKNLRKDLIDIRDLELRLSRELGVNYRVKSGMGGGTGTGK